MDDGLLMRLGAVDEEVDLPMSAAFAAQWRLLLFTTALALPAAVDFSGASKAVAVVAAAYMLGGGSGSDVLAFGRHAHLAVAAPVGFFVARASLDCRRAIAGPMGETGGGSLTIAIVGILLAALPIAHGFGTFSGTVVVGMLDRVSPELHSALFAFGFALLLAALPCPEALEVTESEDEEEEEDEEPNGNGSSIGAGGMTPMASKNRSWVRSNGSWSKVMMEKRALSGSTTCESSSECSTLPREERSPSPEPEVFFIGENPRPEVNSMARCRTRGSSRGRPVALRDTSLPVLLSPRCPARLAAVSPMSGKERSASGLVEHGLALLSRLSLGVMASHVLVIYVLNVYEMRYHEFPCSLPLLVAWSAVVFGLSVAVAVVLFVCLSAPAESFLRAALG